MNPFSQDLGGNGADMDTMVTQEVIDTILNAPEKSASDLVALYLSSMMADPATMDYDVDEVGDRIMEALNRMADEGDDEALLATLGLGNLLAGDNAPVPARAVFIAMLEVVMLKPLALAAAYERLDYHTAGVGVTIIKSFTESLLRDGLDDDDDGDDDNDDDDEMGPAELDSILEDLANGSAWRFGRN